MANNYYIGGGDYFGNNGPNEKFNNEIAPRLLELGISPDDMDEVARIFEDIYQIGYENGENNVYGEIQEGDF